MMTSFIISRRSIIILELASFLSLPGMAFANSTQEGKTFEGNYNWVTGCDLDECHFAQVCNRRINGEKACAHSHSFYVH